MANTKRGQELRSELLRIKATPTERYLVKQAAKDSGYTESDFMRIAIQKALNECMGYVEPMKGTK